MAILGIFILFTVLLTGIGVAQDSIKVADGEYTSTYIYEKPDQDDALVKREDGTVYLWSGFPAEIGTFLEYQSSDEPGEEEFKFEVGFANSNDETIGYTRKDENQKSIALDLNTGSVPAGSAEIYVQVYEWEGALASNEFIEEIRFNVDIVRLEGDIDEDGLSNADEVRAGTKLSVSDTDDDGLLDKEELSVHDTNPIQADTDSDRLSDGQEVNQYGTDPDNIDTDGDGLKDGSEVFEYESDPNKADTDSDGITDSDEVNMYDTDPTRADSDSDGITDLAEVERDTDPLNSDSPSSTENNAEDTQSDTTTQSSETTSEETTITTSMSEGSERGFFSNGSDGPFSFLDNGSITAIGIVLSLLGILVNMTRRV